MKILDFGLVKLLGETDPRLTSTGEGIGNIICASLELLAGRDRLDGRSDLYAVGCLLHHMLTGSTPFPTEGYRALMAEPGLNRADLLAARAGAALCAGTLGRTREALDELRSVLAEQRSLLGPGRPAVLDSRYEITVLLVRTGERHAAEEQLRRLADEEEAVLPVSDPDRGRSRKLLERLRRMA